MLQYADVLLTEFLLQVGIDEDSMWSHSFQNLHPKLLHNLGGPPTHTTLSSTPGGRILRFHRAKRVQNRGKTRCSEEEGEGEGQLSVSYPAGQQRGQNLAPPDKLGQGHCQASCQRVGRAF